MPCMSQFTICPEESRNSNMFSNSFCLTRGFPSSSMITPLVLVTILRNTSVVRNPVKDKLKDLTNSPYKSPSPWKETRPR